MSCKSEVEISWRWRICFGKGVNWQGIAGITLYIKIFMPIDFIFSRLTPSGESHRPNTKSNKLFRTKKDATGTLAFHVWRTELGVCSLMRAIQGPPRVRIATVHTITLHFSKDSCTLDTSLLGASSSDMRTHWGFFPAICASSKHLC